MIPVNPNIYCTVCGGTFPLGHICGQNAQERLETLFPAEDAHRPAPSILRDMAAENIEIMRQKVAAFDRKQAQLQDASGRVTDLMAMMPAATLVSMVKNGAVTKDEVMEMIGGYFDVD